MLRSRCIPFVPRAGIDAIDPSWLTTVLRSRATTAATIALFALAPVAPAAAISIAYTGTDLADTTPGEDLWQYTYSLDAFPFAAGFGFSILFDPALHSDLADPPAAVNVDWDVITLQPDLLLPADGLYDALALTSSPSLGDPFVVSFVFLGVGTPGSQPFVVYDESFDTIESGTTLPVPESGSGALLAVGLAALAAGGRLASRRGAR